MRFLKQFLDFYITTSIHVGIAVFSLLQISKIQLNIVADVKIDYFVFFGTILGYNFLKYYVAYWNLTFTIKKNFDVIVVSLIAFFGMLFYFFKLDLCMQAVFLKIGILVLIYPFIRKFGKLKMVFVSFCLTWITAYTLFMNQELNWIFLMCRFLIIFCLLIPLEICDLKTDSKTITTLPTIIGILNLKILGYCLLGLFIALKFDFYNLIFAFLVGGAIFFSDENKSKYYTGFWVESLPIFWCIFLLFTK